MENNAKYNIGDKVVFLDINSDETNGTIKEIDWTEISSWNKESKPLYLIGTCQYLRTEDEILGLYKKSISLSKEGKRELKKCLHNMFNKLGEYHADLKPVKDESLALLVGLYCYWVDEYNHGKMENLDGVDDEINAYLVQEYHKLEDYR